MASSVSNASHGAHAGNGNPKKGGFWQAVYRIALVVLIGALIALGVIVYGYWAASNRYAQIADENADVIGRDLKSMTVDWDHLRSINPEVCAWVYVPDTVINYPVTYTSDNDKYLNMNFDGATGLATGCGTIFLDCNDKPDFSCQNNVLYGHHRNDGTMFAPLSDFAEQSVFDSHRDVYVLTPSMNYRLSTFSLVRTIGTDEYVQITFPSADKMTEYVQDKIDRSMVTPKEGKPAAASITQLFTFSTCDYNETDGRAVLFSSVAETVQPVNYNKSSAGSMFGSSVNENSSAGEQ